jgi:hypothetical protein
MMLPMGSSPVIDQYTPLDVFVTGVSNYEHNGSAAIGYTQIGEAFYRVTFGTTGAQWESFRDALVRGLHPLATTDNRKLYSIERAPSLRESLQQEITDGLILAHSRSLDAIG